MISCYAVHFIPALSTADYEALVGGDAEQMRDKACPSLEADLHEEGYFTQMLLTRAVQGFRLAGSMCVLPRGAAFL